MNRDSEPNHRPSQDDLDQSLLELHYGLLEDDEADALRRRIDTEPEVAKKWASALTMAGKFSEAAKVEASVATKSTVASRFEVNHREQTLEEFLAPKSKPVESPVSQTKPNATAVEPHPSRSDSGAPGPAGGRFQKIWLLSLASAATVAVAISGLRYFNRLPDQPGDQLRVAVKPVFGATTNSRNEFLVVVGPDDSDATDQAPQSMALGGSGSFDRSIPIVPANISYRVLAQGAVLLFGNAETSRSGPAKIQIPDEIGIPKGAVLHIDATPQDGSQVIKLRVPLEPTRCLTFLSTDRPVYRPGETVFFRSVSLNRRTLGSHVEVPIRYELTDPSGAVVTGAIMEGVTERGVGNGAFVIPEQASGGPYKLIARSLDGYFPDQTCEIEVRRYRAVRLKTDLQFSRRSFSAGDRVEAELVVRRADDTIPTGAQVRMRATVDEMVVFESSGVLGLQGEVAIVFALPKVIRDGEGLLSVVISDGSVTETAARPIPIHTGRAEVDFYPEGGYLVGGLDNRVYFAARDTLGNPIEIAGEILSQSGRVVAKVATVRDGMGRFEFKPESGQRYSLRITSPLDITETPWLPSVVEAKPVLNTGTGVFEADQPIAIAVRSTKRQRCIIRSVCRGELVGVETVDLGLGETRLELPIQERAHGVIRLTVLDAEGEIATPLVERLVYRKGNRRLNISASSDDGKRSHSPGDSVRVTIDVRDEQNRPVPGAVLGVSVVDDAALSLRQDEIPSIATHFLLTSEIRSPEDLEHANFYLSEDPGAAESLDLLLGTQGWRRFVSGTPDNFEESFRESLTRLLELDGRRAGLIGETATNDSSLAEQLQLYQLRLRTAWKGFVAEIRIALVIIGALWLVALVLRPRGSAAAAGLLLITIGLVIQSGCGASHGPYVVETVEGSSAGSVEADKYAMEESESPATRPSDSQAAGTSEEAEEEAPFVQRVVRTFLGQRQGAKSPDMVHARISSDQLQRWAKSRDLDAQALADQLMEELRFPIRQYAHIHRPSEDNTRRDFAETLYWNPVMVTDSFGTATVRFDLPDSLTMFRVQIDGHTSRGRLGSGGGSLKTTIPVEVEPKVPLEVTAGDRIDLPIGIVNRTKESGAFDLVLELDEALKTEEMNRSTSIDSGGRITEVVSIDVTQASRRQDARIRVSGALQGGTEADSVERTVRIVPDGFPFQNSYSGTVSRSAHVNATIPKSIVDGTLAGRITLYPSTRSQLSAGLESILREPHGCFEQASASNYPNVMAFTLLQLEGAVDERARRRTISLLRRGYRKLTSYECSTLGYEWFGNDPGHEALSAFGLMQFSEMAKFIEVDREMLDRTRDWLLSRRDGQGGFKRNPRHLHSWSVEQSVVNAYLLWALSQTDLSDNQSPSMMKQLSTEVDVMRDVAVESDDPYLIALSAITLRNVGQDQSAAQLLDKLAKMQRSDGSLEGKTTVTQSGGISRTVETTALAILAWAKSKPHRSASDSAGKWLIKNRRGGGFGSTQATVLALKALIAIHDRLGSDDGGQVEVAIDGDVVETIRWQGRQADGVVWELTAPVLQAVRQNPKTKLTLKQDGDQAIPFSVHFSGVTKTPRSDPSCPIAMRLGFSGQQLESSTISGDTIDIIAEIENTSDKGQPMTVSSIGVPGGLEPVIESLDELRESGEIDYYELKGREIVLYWRTLAPGEVKRIPISCVAAVGGKYTGPPSRSYLYYTAESKHWTKPLVIEIE